MLKIAVVANTFQDAKQFAQYKFKDKIKEWHGMHTKFILNDGSEVYLVYGEAEGDRYKYLSMLYDAYCVAPAYQSLLDVIRERCSRPT